MVTYNFETDIHLFLIHTIKPTISTIIIYIYIGTVGR